MTKPNQDPREEAKREDQQKAQQQAQQEAHKNQQRAEEHEVAGRHKGDGIKDHQGADKGPRGQ